MFNKRDKNNKDNFLLYIPKIKQSSWEERKGRVVLLFYHTKFVERLMRWLVKKPYVSDIELDELGSSVWRLIDGKRSIYDIGQCLRENHGEKCEPVYDRLIMYIRYLVRKGWLALNRGNQ